MVLTVRSIGKSVDQGVDVVDDKPNLVQGVSPSHKLEEELVEINAWVFKHLRGRLLAGP